MGFLSFLKIQRHHILWQRGQLLSMVIMTMLALAGEEWLAEKVGEPERHIPTEAERSHPLGPQGLGHPHHTTLETLIDDNQDVIYSLRSFALPNYWIWYDPKALTDLVRLQSRALQPLVYMTVYNAALCTPCVAMTHAILLMILLFTVVSNPKHPALYLWALPILSFVFDLTEDLLLLVITLGYPMFQYPVLMALTSWCTLLKWLTWFVIVSIDVGCVVLRLRNGPLTREEKIA